MDDPLTLGDSRAGEAPRIGTIDGLRGYAFLAVLGFHCAVWAYPTWDTRIVGFGHLGVDLFFVISGFVMRRIADHTPRIDARSFLRRRFLRIAIPYWVALAIVIAATGLIEAFAGPSWYPAGNQFQSVFPLHPGIVANTAAHLLVLHGASPAWSHSFDGAFWSLSPEWQFYLLVPAFAWSLRRWSAHLVAVAALAASLGFAALVHITDARVSDGLLPWWIGTFVVGMLVAGLDDPGRIRWILAGIGAAVIAVPLEWSEGPGHWLARPLWALVFGAVVLLLERRRTPLLTGAAIVRLGRASYSGYLVHGALFMLICIPLSRAAASSTTRSIVYYCGGAPLAIAAALAFNRWVEEPAHRLARRGSEPTSDAGAPAPQLAR